MTSSPASYDFSVSDAPAFDMLAAGKIAKLPASKRRDKVLTTLKRAAKRAAPDLALPDDVTTWTDDDVESVVDSLADAWDDASKRSFLTLLRDSLIEQEKADLAGATAALASSAPTTPATPAAVSQPPSPTKPASPTKTAAPALPIYAPSSAPPAAAAAPAPAASTLERPPAMPPRMGLGIALPGLAAPKPAPAPVPEPSSSEPTPEPGPPKPLEDVRKNRVKPPRPPRAKGLHVVEDGEEGSEGNVAAAGGAATPEESSPIPAAVEHADNETPPPIPPLPVIQQSSPIDLGIPGLKESVESSPTPAAVVAEPPPPATLEPAVIVEPVAPPRSLPEPTPAPIVAAPPPTAEPGLAPIAAPVLPPLPPVPPRRSVPATPSAESHEAEHEPTPSPQHVEAPAPGLPPREPSPTRASLEARPPVVPAAAPAPAPASAPAPAQVVAAAAPVAVAAAVVTAEHEPHEEKKGMFSKMKSMFKKGGKPKDGPGPAPAPAPAQTVAPMPAAVAVAPSPAAAPPPATPEPLPRASIASRTSLESGDSKRVSIASVEMPVAPQRPASQVVHETASIPEEPSTSQPQASPTQRPALPNRPMSVGTDLGASIASSSPSAEHEAPRSSVDVPGDSPSAGGEEHGEDGEEVKPKKYVPNAAMSALAAAMKSGVSIGGASQLQKRRSAGSSLRAAAPMDIITPGSPAATAESPEGAAQGSPELQRMPSASAKSVSEAAPPAQLPPPPALPVYTPVPEPTPVAQEPSHTSLADAGLATAAVEETEHEEEPEAATHAEEQATEPAHSEERAAAEEVAHEEPVARKPKLIYGARPDAMVAAISGELKKRSAAPVPTGPEEDSSAEPSHEEGEAAATTAVAEAPVAEAAAAPKPAVPTRPRVPPKVPPKTSTGTPQASPSAESSEAAVAAPPAESGSEDKGMLERRPTASASTAPVHDVSWNNAPVPLVITKKSAIDTSNDEVVEENMLHWLQKNVEDKEFSKDNLYSSLTDGIVLIRALEKASGSTAGRYNKRAVMPAQQMDNLQVLVNFMTKLGIETNNVRPLDFFNQEKQKILVAFVSILRKYGPSVE